MPEGAVRVQVQLRELGVLVKQPIHELSLAWLPLVTVADPVLLRIEKPMP